MYLFVCVGPFGISFETPGQVQPVLSFKEKARNLEDFISQETKDESLCHVFSLLLFLEGQWRQPSSLAED